MPKARDVALKVLNRVDRDRAYAAALLSSELHNINDPREAAFATELVFGSLRRRTFLDSLIASVSKRGIGKLDPMTLQILRLGAYQVAFLKRIPARAAVSEAVNQVRKSGLSGMVGFVNAVLRRLCEAKPESLQPNESSDQTIEDMAVHLSLPNWLVERLVDSNGKGRTVAIARAFNRPSRRTLRVNLSQVSRGEVLKNLAGDGKPGRLSQWSVDVMSPKAASKLVEQGLASYQDEGAQLVAMALDPQPGEKIIDACAGRGGKTSALAMMTGGRAEIVAADRSASKLERLVFELDRQGFEATTVTADLAVGSGGLSGEFNRVLLDAPCSGTGTVGRRPEIRWRLEPETVDALTEIQSALLDTAASLLAPGGRLVYAVCSVLPEEGLDLATSFLERHRDFHLVTAPPVAWPEEIPWQGGAILVDPAVCNTDGYQIIVMER